MNKQSKFFLTISYIPLVIYIASVIVFNLKALVFHENISASNAGALGMFFIFAFMILSLPCFAWSLIAFKASDTKLAKILSTIALVFWTGVLILTIILNIR